MTPGLRAAVMRWLAKHYVTIQMNHWCPCAVGRADWCVRVCATLYQSRWWFV